MSTRSAKKPSTGRAASRTGRAMGADVLHKAQAKGMALGADVLHQAQAKGLALAAGALPKIAAAAERTGQSVSRASTKAGHAAAAKLRTMEPGTAATLASAFAASGLIGPVVRFAIRRPFAAMIGGVLIAQAGKALWHSMRTAPAPAQPAPALPAAEAAAA